MRAPSETARARFRLLWATALALLVGAVGSLLAPVITVPLAVVVGAGRKGALGVYLVAAVYVAVLAASAMVGVNLRERLLRRGEAPSPPLRSPRLFRSVIAFLAGYFVGVGPLVVALLFSQWPRRTDGLIWSLFVVPVFLFGPTAGLLVTRALCRRWGTPRPGAPSAAPAPAAPVPAPPAPPAPDGRFLPAAG